MFITVVLKVMVVTLCIVPKNDAARYLRESRECGDRGGIKCAEGQCCVFKNGIFICEDLQKEGGSCFYDYLPINHYYSRVCPCSKEAPHCLDNQDKVYFGVCIKTDECVKGNCLLGRQNQDKCCIINSEGYNCNTYPKVKGGRCSWDSSKNAYFFCPCHFLITNIRKEESISRRFHFNQPIIPDYAPHYKIIECGSDPGLCPKDKCCVYDLDGLHCEDFLKEGDKCSASFDSDYSEDNYVFRCPCSKEAPFCRKEKESYICTKDSKGKRILKDSKGKSKETCD